MKILVTGVSGFIGSNLVHQLAERGDEVVGLDSINSYYDIRLKYGRMQSLTGIQASDVTDNKFVVSTFYPNYRFIKMDMADNDRLQQLFKEERFDRVCHLAAQPGVRYSIENPYAYINSNVVCFLNILEGCRHHNVAHLVYASSSSVYGLNAGVPFSEEDGIAHPVSLYAATKKADELMAHCYSHLYNLPTTGLRFFTVYGPWGRPDMAPYLFTDAIMNNRPIKIFNQGDMLRDFTYIDDIVEGLVRVVDSIAVPNSAWNPEKPLPDSSCAPYRIYNIGNSKPVKLMDFISALEQAVGKEAEKIFLPMQPGDVYRTDANTEKLAQDFGFQPHTDIQTGVDRFVEWYREFNGVK